MSRPRYLLWAVLLVTLLAFAVRAVSLDAQSLWRDEVDALCYAYQFPYLTIQALRAAPASDLRTPCACPPPPFRVSPPPTPPTTRLAQTLTGMLHQNGPLYFFLLRGWVALVGTSEYGMRFLSLLGGVLAVPLTYALGRRLFSRWTGLVAALLMGISPYQTWYAQEVKMYTLVTALVLLALYGLRRAVEGDGRRWWAAMVLATTLAIYLHILAALVIPVLVACF
ncbi:MAG TPA: phospholipid carrier-dependent glycosyltransferase, partial [Anaerolineae bacterium]|nr:phospholipid carrier-dependent glycosyltransferase [Anaerolineae bacterium]